MVAGMAKVLVVDDDDDIRFLIAYKLTSAGYDVTLASDGTRGLDAARREHPDLILLDWMMPEMSGVEVCTALKAEPANQDTPVILITARSQPADIERGFAAGATDYVLKPFLPSELLARVTAILYGPEQLAPA